jgi:soluble lytic murein transglycosylase
MLRVLVILSFVLAALPAPAFAQADPFLLARDAFRAGNQAKLAEQAAKLRGHVLEPYVTYYRLRLRLEEASPGEISDFLNHNAGSYPAELLRRDWLKVLGRRGEWELFGVAFPTLVYDDPDVACYNLQRRYRGRDATATAEMMVFWASPRELPDGCMAIAAGEMAAGRLTTRHVWDRVRALLEAGQVHTALRAADALPAVEALEPKLVAQINDNPQRYLDRGKPDFSRRAHREMVMFAVVRLAQKDPELAASRWDRRRQAKLLPAERDYVWSQLAVLAAKRHLPVALEWYASAGAAPLTDEQLAWRARAGLRALNWVEVKNAIDRMTPAGRDDAAWVYWAGRSLRAQGQREEADALFRRIAGEHHFYGRLALEELGETVAVPARAEPPTKDAIEEMRRNAGLQRALALFGLDLRSDAVREWHWTVRTMDDRELIAAAELARRHELWDRAINTADRTVGSHDFGLRFLAPYKDAFSEQAKAQGLEESWVLGLVRQESRFIASARSGVGASGLMQIMPATAKWIAKRIGMKDFRPEGVADPGTNIVLGTSYLRYVLDELDGSPVLAAAAYNAGPGRARRWKGPQPLEGAIYTETIPFNETRDYVKKVMSNTVYYAALYGGEARSLKARLGVIPAHRFGEGLAATLTGEPTVQ